MVFSFSLVDFEDTALGNDLAWEVETDLLLALGIRSFSGPWLQLINAHEYSFFSPDNIMKWLLDNYPMDF